MGPLWKVGFGVVSQEKSAAPQLANGVFSTRSLAKSSIGTGVVETSMTSVDRRWLHVFC